MFTRHFAHCRTFLAWKCQRDDYPSLRALSNIPNKDTQLCSHNTIMSPCHNCPNPQYQDNPPVRWRMCLLLSHISPFEDICNCYILLKTQTKDTLDKILHGCIIMHLRASTLGKTLHGRIIMHLRASICVHSRQSVVLLHHQAPRASVRLISNALHHTPTTLYCQTIFTRI